ncbi:hypothetical protein [Salsuginibacillus kocurii]|uniref:hypothetical protein n=1 Tax=Salsuginibacillus kocurii TaxID=427078 RepID=UPI00036E3282|nr:hypothetical protein [Salsuginibacillus kocurii]
MGRALMAIVAAGVTTAALSRWNQNNKKRSMTSTWSKQLNTRAMRKRWQKMQKQLSKQLT